MKISDVAAFFHSGCPCISLGCLFCIAGDAIAVTQLQIYIKTAVSGGYKLFQVGYGIGIAIVAIVVICPYGIAHSLALCVQRKKHASQ